MTHEFSTGASRYLCPKAGRAGTVYRDGQDDSRLGTPTILEAQLDPALPALAKLELFHPRHWPFIHHGFSWLAPIRPVQSAPSF